jgi:hypothetical protein
VPMASSVVVLVGAEAAVPLMEGAGAAWTWAGCAGDGAAGAGAAAGAAGAAGAGAAGAGAALSSLLAQARASRTIANRPTRSHGRRKRWISVMIPPLWAWIARAYQRARRKSTVKKKARIAFVRPCSAVNGGTIAESARRVVAKRAPGKRTRGWARAHPLVGWMAGSVA